DQLAPAAELVDHGRAIAEVAAATLRGPQFLSGLLVEGDDEAILGTAGQTDELIAVDEWMGREPPLGHRRFIIFREVLRPDELAVRGFVAAEVAHGAERVDAVAIDGGHDPRPAGIHDRVTHREVDRPQLLTLI